MSTESDQTPHGTPARQPRGLRRPISRARGSETGHPDYRRYAPRRPRGNLWLSTTDFTGARRAGEARRHIHKRRGQWPKTGPSLASIFTGRYPKTTGLNHRAAQQIPNEYMTLPELFQSAGYRTLGVVSNAVLSGRVGLEPGLR